MAAATANAGALLAQTAKGGEPAAPPADYVVEPEKRVKVRAHADVVVCGGGPAGIGAAIAAARSGANTLLLEDLGGLGGTGSYGISPTRGYHPAFHDGIYPFTSPVDYFPPNGYGLYDMAGSIWQWCWDLYDAAWYAKAGATQKDTPGPDSNQNGFRVMRGGSWHRSANFARWAHRGNDAQDLGWITFGFRCVRR